MLSLLAALGGCATTLAASPIPAALPQPKPAQDDADFSADGSPVEKEPPNTEELVKGHTFRDIYKPVSLTCDEWGEQIKVAKGSCAFALWVKECGEKDEAGKPTGQYYGNACPECETMTGLQKQAEAQGCPT